MSALPTQQLPPQQIDPGQLAALLAQLQAGGGAARLAAPLPAAGAFGMQPAGMPAPTAVHIPLKIPVGQGSVKVLFSFGPEFADPNNLLNLLNALANAGLPIDIYVPKQNGFGGGGGYGNGGGNNWGNRGGGYNGGGRWGQR